jgi:hypothetical protein
VSDSTSGEKRVTRIPLTIVSSVDGQTTDGVLVAVMASDLDDLEASREWWATARSEDISKDYAALKAQIDRLAQFIMDEVPGEPSAGLGAVDTAIRIMRASGGSSS